MKKRLIFTVLVPLLFGCQAMARTAPEEQPEYRTERLSEENLDTLLAPIALYPDTLVTHILIASTYPLQVIEADRWRQDNQALEGERLQQALENIDWDPSVKALVPFTDVLRHMSDDLSWLQDLGDAVITNEDWVLDRVQALRLQASQSGNLQSNDYQQVSTEDKIIVIESRQPDVVYIPYYDTRYVYGRWHHHHQPVFWPTTVRIALGPRIYWGPRVSISAGFYFGNIWWPERHIVIRSTPVHHYVRPVYHKKRASVKEYHRWQHNVSNRHARYSKRVITHKPAIVKQHRSLDNAAKHRELYTRTQALSSHPVHAEKRAKLIKNDNKPHKPLKYGPDAEQMKKRLKGHDNGERNHQRQLVKAPKTQLKADKPHYQKKVYAPAERKQPVHQQPKERVISNDRKWEKKPTNHAQRERQSQVKSHQSRPMKQSHNRPAKQDHAQNPRIKREH